MYIAASKMSIDSYRKSHWFDFDYLREPHLLHGYSFEPSSADRIDNMIQ